MPMEPFETEGEAMGLYREAKEDPDEPPGAVAIARKILGRDAIRTAWVEGLVDGASLRRENGRWLIYVSRRLTFAELNFAVAHELGELALSRVGYREDNREHIANAIAGALILPRPAFQRAYTASGFCLADIAAEFIAPEGAVALRVGEVQGEPVALLTSSRIHRRDPHNDLPNDTDLRRLARQTLDPWHPVQMVRCGDAMGSVAFRRVG